MDTCIILESFHDKLSDIADKLLVYANNRRIFLLEGAMGSGKTTLVKALCHALGVVNTVNSPTFALINEYITTNDEHIYHFDCYRIHNIREAIMLDFESYFDSGHYCFIEWPSKIESILPMHYLIIRLKATTSMSRNLICNRY